MKISLVVAAYNEENEIEKHVRKLDDYARKHFKRDYEIIVVDDGSTDGTLAVLKKLSKQLGIVVASNGRNLGPGAAFRTGMAVARGDVIVTLDSDLSFPITQIPELVGYVAKDGYDLVITSPYARGGGIVNVPLLREFLSRASVLAYSLSIREFFTSYSSFFRAYKRSALPKLRFVSNGFESQAEIIYLAVRNGLRIKEVPSVLSLNPGRKSHFRIFRDVLKHLRMLLGVIIWGDVKRFLGLLHSLFAR